MRKQCRDLGNAIRTVVSVNDGDFPKHAAVSRAPALQGVVVQHCTRVGSTGQDALGGEAGAEVDGNQVVAHLVGAVADSSGVALSELAIAIITPALDGGVAQHCTRVVTTT